MASEAVISLLLDAKDFKRLSVAAQRARLVKHYSEWFSESFELDTVDNIRTSQRLQVYATRVGQSVGAVLKSLLESAQDHASLDGAELDAFEAALAEPPEFAEPPKRERTTKPRKAAKAPKSLTLKEYQRSLPLPEPEDELDEPYDEADDFDPDVDLPVQPIHDDREAPPEPEHIANLGLEGVSKYIKPTRSVQVGTNASKPADHADIKIRESLDTFADQWK